MRPAGRMFSSPPLPSSPCVLKLKKLNVALNVSLIYLIETDYETSTWQMYTEERTGHLKEFTALVKHTNITSVAKYTAETSKNEAKNNSSGHKVNLLVQVVD